jgi:uncharacterized protein YggE
MKTATVAVLAFATSVSAAPVRTEAARAEPYVATISSTPPQYGPAPWWMREGIIAAAGEVQTHIPANRAQFSAQFSAIDRSLATAQKNAADRVRALAKALQAYGADKAQVETSLHVQPIYEQYRDKDGNLQTNTRADKIERYEVRVAFSVQVRDLAVLERAYAAVISAHPASIGQVYFRLEPSNETNTELFKAAVGDAARRARLAAEATGAKLGRVHLIDPTARACETDVLVTGAPRGYGQDAGGVEEVMVTGSRRADIQNVPVAPPPPPPAPGEEVTADQLLPLQAPLQTLQRKACVVYGLE